jgi:LysM repeat protein
VFNRCAFLTLAVATAVTAGCNTVQPITTGDTLPQPSTTVRVTIVVPTTSAGPLTATPYTVVAGDSLASIAKAHCLETGVLVYFNEWADGFDHEIFPNDVIKLPPEACTPDGS